MNKTIKLNKDKKDKMISSIKKYFYNERNEDLGDLAAALILDFVIEELSQEFYNQGIYDAYKCLSDKMEDVLALQKF